MRASRSSAPTERSHCKPPMGTILGTVQFFCNRHWLGGPYVLRNIGFLKTSILWTKEKGLPYGQRPKLAEGFDPPHPVGTPPWEPSSSRIVSPEVFRQVQEKFANKVHNRSNKQLLDELRIFLHKHGRLSTKLMCPANGLASYMVYTKRFGSMKKVYDLVPYRIWSTDWFRNPGLQTKHLLKYLRELHPPVVPH